MVTLGNGTTTFTISCFTTRSKRNIRRFLRQSSVEYRLVERSKILLRLSQGGSNTGIGKELGKNYKTIKKCRLRYLKAAVSFKLILNQSDKSDKEKRKELELALANMLQDATRSGVAVK